MFVSINEVEVGQRYIARLRNGVVPVRILEIRRADVPTRSGMRKSRQLIMLNEKTGREVMRRSAACLRSRLSDGDEEEDGGSHLRACEQTSALSYCDAAGLDLDQEVLREIRDPQEDLPPSSPGSAGSL